MTQTWRTAAILLILVFVTWLPRVFAAEHVVTPDERKWLARSANFYHALATGDLAQTFQREHPGVTVMWAGTLGFLQRYPAYARETPGQFGWEREEIEPWLRDHSTHTPLELLQAGRRWVALLVVLSMLATFFALRRLMIPALALLVLFYLAVDPFFIGHSFELHPDSLVAVFYLVATVSYLAWLVGGGQRRYLVVSGVAAGLAWLTKVPALLIIPPVALLAFFEVARARRTFWRTVAELSLWALLGCVTFVALWPAFWVSPLGVIRQMIAELTLYVEGHINPNFFLGQVTQDPGVLFYPLAYLLRITPATAIGLVAAALLLLRRAWPFSLDPARRATYGLLLFAAVFALGMTAGAKKFDRYLLPAALLLDVVAVLGWAGLAQWVTAAALKSRGAAAAQDDSRVPPRVVVIVLLALLTGHALFAALHHPYYLTYYNPLLGGAATAERTMVIGWGEGLDQAAAWLNPRLAAEDARVVAWYGDGPLSYFLDSDAPVMDFWQPDFWIDAGYALLYVNQRQRAIPSAEALAAIQGGELLTVVSDHGVELARIYRMPDVPPAFTDLHTESATEFRVAESGVEIRLAAYALGQRSVLAGNSLLIRLHLQNRAEVFRDVVQVLQLRDASDQVVWQRETTLPAQDWRRHDFLHVYEEVEAPAGAPAGDYRLVVAYRRVDDAHAYLLPASHTAGSSDPFHLVTTLAVDDAVAVDGVFEWDGVQLSDLRHTPAGRAGESIRVTLNAAGQTDGSRKLSLRLVDAAGTVVAQADKEIGHAMEFMLDVPAEASPGQYTLVAVLYDPETLAPLANRGGQFEVPLTSIELR